MTRELREGEPVYVKTVSVHYERKINLGDYESATVGIQIWADVDDEELDGVMRRLWSMAKENVRAQVLPLVSKQKAKTEETFMGLPVELQEAINVD